MIYQLNMTLPEEVICSFTCLVWRKKSVLINDFSGKHDYKVVQMMQTAKKNCWRALYETCGGNVFSTDCSWLDKRGPRCHVLAPASLSSLSVSDNVACAQITWRKNSASHLSFSTLAILISPGDQSQGLTTRKTEKDARKKREKKRDTTFMKNGKRVSSPHNQKIELCQVKTETARTRWRGIYGIFERKITVVLSLSATLKSRVTLVRSWSREVCILTARANDFTASLLSMDLSSLYTHIHIYETSVKTFCVYLTF